MIAYEPHPVSPERKAELRAQGKRIVDIRYRPAHLADPEPVVGAENVPSKSEIAGMKKADVIEWLDAHGVDPVGGGVADLRAQLRRVMFMDA